MKDSSKEDEKTFDEENDTEEFNTEEDSGEEQEEESEEIKHYKMLSEELKKSDLSPNGKNKEFPYQPIVKVTDTMLWLYKRKGAIANAHKPTPDEREKEISAVRHIKDLWQELSKMDSFMNFEREEEEDDAIVDNLLTAISNADDPYYIEYVNAEKYLRQKVQEYRTKNRSLK